MNIKTKLKQDLNSIFDKEIKQYTYMQSYTDIKIKKLKRNLTKYVLDAVKKYLPRITKFQISTYGNLGLVQERLHYPVLQLMKSTKGLLLIINITPTHLRKESIRIEIYENKESVFLNYTYVEGGWSPLQ